MFEKTERVRFGHCDPAGIVYYPRYFEMLNGLVEDWFTEGLGINYAKLLGVRRVGLPTVHLAVDFQRISRMGDLLSQRLTLSRLGRSSLGLDVQFSGDDGIRLALTQVLVCTSLDTHKPIAWPDDLRAALQKSQETPSS